MLSIAIYNDDLTAVDELKNIIADYLIERKIFAKVTVFNNEETLLTVPSRFDIYFLDMGMLTDIINLGRKMQEIDDSGHFVYISESTEHAHIAAKAKADYFTIYPYDKEEIFEILEEIKEKVKEDTVIIKVPGGEKRVRINQLNYIDISKRCLCYHLKEGAMFDGQTLRESFGRAIHPLENHPSCLFLSPSFLINLASIDTVLNDRVIFEDGSSTYITKNQHDRILEKWKKYHLLEI